MNTSSLLLFAACVVSCLSCSDAHTAPSPHDQGQGSSSTQVPKSAPAMDPLQVKGQVSSGLYRVDSTNCDVIVQPYDKSDDRQFAVLLAGDGPCAAARILDVSNSVVEDAEHFRAQSRNVWLRFSRLSAVVTEATVQCQLHVTGTGSTGGDGWNLGRPLIITLTADTDLGFIAEPLALLHAETQKNAVETIAAASCYIPTGKILRAGSYYSRNRRQCNPIVITRADRPDGGVDVAVVPTTSADCQALRDTYNCQPHDTACVGTNQNEWPLYLGDQENAKLGNGGAIAFGKY